MVQQHAWLRFALTLSAALAIGCGDDDGGPDASTRDSSMRDTGSAMDGATPRDSGSADTGPGPTGTLSERYPNDAWDPGESAIIFAEDFEDAESGLELASYSGDSFEVTTDSSVANEGNGALHMAFTLAGIESRGDASIKATYRFPLPASGEYFVRYYMRYGEGTARPHHGNNTRVHAEGADRGGTAGIVPSGDERFNTTIDIDGMGRQFFYTYWHEMRSGRCNDGTATPGCAGDQGSTYYYGNGFRPADQVIVDRHAWACYEYRVRANTPGSYDGAQTLWTNDALVGTFEMGAPLGEWLRDSFYTEGEWGTDPTMPFEGYNFRTSADVNQVRVTFELYQEWGTLSGRRDDTPAKAAEQAVFYDDIVIATERIGCRVDG